MKIIYLDASYFDEDSDFTFIRLRFLRFLQHHEVEKIVFSHSIKDTPRFHQLLKFIKKYSVDIQYAPCIVDELTNLRFEDNMWIQEGQQVMLMNQNIYMIDTLEKKREIIYLDLFTTHQSIESEELFLPMKDLMKNKEKGIIISFNKNKMN